MKENKSCKTTNQATILEVCMILVKKTIFVYIGMLNPTYAITLDTRLKIGKSIKLSPKGRNKSPLN